MKLFLTSSGIPLEFAHLFLKSFNKPAHEIKLYFIPTAADVEANGQQWVTKAQNQFSLMGINVIWYNIAYKIKEQMEIELQDADCIWVNGGNTFYLLEVARSTGFDEVLRNLVLNKNVIYGGTSAGTYLACQTIHPTFWKNVTRNDILVDDYNAIKLAEFNTFVHYNEEKYKETIQKNHNPEISDLYLIPDQGFIVVDDEKIKLVNGARKY